MQNQSKISLGRHPIGFWFIFWGEFAERCSYYGMRAILALYMSDKLGMGDSSSGIVMSLFIAGCYFLTVPGGYIADNYLGKYWTIVGFSLPYILGHFILGIENFWFLAIALTLLAMGSGVIKPNISTLMGMTYDQQRPGEELLRSNAFSIYYLSINIGAAISSFAMPWIRTQWGYQIAFLFPALLMIAAFIVFALGKPFYAVEVISRKERTPEERKLQFQVMTRLGGLFVLVTFFWAIFDQSASTWIFFAKSHMDCTMFGKPIDPDAVQAFNPVFIILLLPLVTFFWNYLYARGIKVRATDKMIVGFVLTAITMAIMSAAGWVVGAGERQTVMKEGKPVEQIVVAPERKVSVWWQVIAYIVLTTAETLISVTGMELAFVAAPPSMKSFATGLWWSTVGAGNLIINVPFTWLYGYLNPGPYFGVLAIALLAVSVAFVYVGRRFNAAFEAEQETAAIAAA